MAGGLMFFSATACLGVGAAAMTAVLRLADPVDRVLAFATLALCQLALTLIAAGAFSNTLTPRYVFVLNAGVAVVALTAAARAGMLRSSGSGIWPGLVRSAAASRTHPWVSALLLTSGAVFAWRAFLVVLLPPYSYDGLSYHLTTVAEWISARRLVANPLSLCCAHYPANGELAFLWPMLLLGRDTIVDGVQLLFAVLGAVAVAGIARSIGVSSSAAAATGSIFFLTPIVVAQSTSNYVDVIVVATLLASLYFIVRALTHPRRHVLLALAGGMAGFAAGTKPTAVIFAMILFALLSFRLVLSAVRRLLPPRTVAAGLAAFAVPLLAVGSFWYVRNALEFGNPVHPFRIEVAGIVVFSGSRSLNEILTVPHGFENEPTWRRVARSWWSDVPFWQRTTYTYESRLGGLGPLWPYLGLPLTLVLAVRAVRRRDAAILSVVVVVALSFVLLPYKWWSRFTIPLAAMGALSVVYMVENLTRRAARIVLAGVVSTLVAAGVWLSINRIDPAGRGRVLSVSAAVHLVGRTAVDRTVGALFFPEYRWVDRVPARSRIGVELRAEAIRFVYPLFGPTLSNHVSALAGGGAAAFDDLVRRDRLDYVVVGQGGAYARWARMQPEAFARVASGSDGIAVYRVLDT